MKISRYFSFIVLIAVITLLAILFYRVMVSFFVPLFLAVLAVVIFRPWHRWILVKFNNRQAMAALVTTISIFLAVLIPIGLLITFAILEGRTALRRFQVDNVANEVLQLRKSFHLDIPAINELRATEAAIEKITSVSLVDADLTERNKIFAEADLAVHAFAQQAGLPTKYGTEPKLSDFFRTLTPADSWHRFVYEVEQLKAKLEPKPPQPAPELEQPETNATDQTIPSEDQSIEPELTLPQQMRKTLTAMDDFKSAYCGGRSWYWLKMLANPTADELDGYKQTATNLVKEQLFSAGGPIAALLVKLIVGLAIMVIAVYFFLLDGPKMIEALKSMSPISDSHEEELVQEFMRVSRAVVLATLVSAVAQGILAGLGFFAAGLGNVFLLTLLTICFGIIPIFGAWVVWLPASVWLLVFEHQTGRAVALALYGLIVVSQIDNFIKPYILHGHSNLHPLFALLSVLGGVVALGPIGILIGPMIVVFLQTLLNILQRELRTMDSPGSALASENPAETVNPPSMEQAPASP